MAKLFVQKAAQAPDEVWQRTIGRLHGPGVTNPTIASLELPSSASQDEDSDDMDFPVPRKSRLSAPQLQAQLSRLTDRSRLRRLKVSLLSKGAWQQVTRIEDLCHAQVSQKWLYHLDACAGSVLTPNDNITYVLKRLGNRVWVGWQTVPLLPFPSWTHSWNIAETCSNADATRGHNACVHAVVCGMELADPDITAGPRGSPLRNRGRPTSSPPLLSPDAVRPWMCAWLPPS